MSTLQKLIRACVDDQRMLQHESKLVDTQRADALQRLARERGRFVADLDRLEPHAARRRSIGSWVELLREAGRDVFVFALGRNTGDSFAICRRSCARTEARYDKALEGSWSDDARHVIAAQRRRLHEEADELVHLQFQVS
jgi:hypothetical protein